MGLEGGMKRKLEVSRYKLSHTEQVNKGLL